MDQSDEDLVACARAGDGAAFGRLVERHYDLVYRLSYRVLGARAEAEDLAQDVCAGLAARLAGFRGEARFTTWLHRLVLNAARDRLRRTSARSRAATGWGDVEHARRAEAAEARDGLDWLQTAMARLSPELRETVALVLGEEMTHAAAAEVLGLSEGTVSWRMSEVKKALRALAAEEVME